VFFLKRTIVKNTLTLSTGTAIASLIPILLQPLLRRLYSPEDFGAFAVYLSITGILVVVSTLRYELAVVLPERDEEAGNVVFLSLFIALLFNTIVFIVLLLVYKGIIRLFNFPVEYSLWLYFIPLSAFLFSAFNVLNYWLIRQKAFRSSASSKIVRRGGEGLVQASLGRIGITGAGLFIGDLAGHTVNFFAVRYLAFRSGLTLKSFNWAILKNILKRYCEFPLYSTIPAFMNTVTLAMPILIVNKFYSESTTGQLDLARLVLFIPLVFLSEPLAQVFFQYATEKKLTKQSILPQVSKMILMLTISAITGIILIQVWSDELILFVFGDDWQTAAGFSTILVFSVGLRFIIDPFRYIFAAQEKIWILSAWQVFYFLTILSLLMVRDLEISQFLTIYVILESACYIILLILIFNTLIRYEKRLKVYLA